MFVTISGSLKIWVLVGAALLTDGGVTTLVKHSYFFERAHCESARGVAEGRLHNDAAIVQGVWHLECIPLSLSIPESWPTPEDPEERGA